MIVVFLDLKRAFDTVNHRILIKKLYAYGIRAASVSGLKATYATDPNMLYMVVKNPTLEMLPADCPLLFYCTSMTLLRYLISYIVYYLPMIPSYS